MTIRDLIYKIWLTHVELSSLWKEKNKDSLFNQKKTTVANAFVRKEIYEQITEYRNFINLQFESSILDEIIKDLKTNNLCKSFESRIKNLNSIDNKLTIYTNTQLHEYGKGPINKCFNDLLGMRFVCPKENNLSIEQLNLIIEDLKLTDKIKIIDSSKPDGYNAIHLYFKLDNYSFLWELQFWNEENYQTNKDNHEKYKQQYITREEEYKDENNNLN